MNSSEVRKKYIDFFVKRGHVEIPPAPLVLENDPTTLFTSSGMQPLVPYLMGERHPKGKRLVNSQPSIRVQDIEEVGDNRHTTFFEMLGNWSLGDYFKAEQLPWIWEFLTKELGLSKDRLWVSVFEGSKEVPRDEESVKIWKELGVPENRIFCYPAKKNWWSRSGTPEEMPPGEIGGPDSEVFFDFGEWRKIHENSPFKNEECHPNCDCGRFLEIANSVFIQYKKNKYEKLEELPQKNVDFGGGLERLVAATKDNPDIFFGDLFWPVIESVQGISAVKFVENSRDYRIIADHLKAAFFLITSGVVPSNKQQGYILRRLIRRAIIKMKNIRVPEAYMISDDGFQYEGSIYGDIAEAVFSVYKNIYFRNVDINNVIKVLENEANKFYTVMEKGIKLLGKVRPFDLYQTYGLPLEVIEELYKERKLKFYKEELKKQIEKHKELSRTAGKRMFKGGLGGHSETEIKYHTATHLLHQALRIVLGKHVHQAGSNITAERLRFDFTHPSKLTDEEIEKVEGEINKKIDENLKVTREEMPKEKALKEGALAFFPERYPDITSVYTIGPLGNWYSKELCGGPHVAYTREVGRVKIERQESVAQGVRRIYAVLE